MSNVTLVLSHLFKHVGADVGQFDALSLGTGAVDGRLAAWRSAQPEAIARVADAVQGLTEGEMTVSRLSVAAGLLGDLARSI